LRTTANRADLGELQIRTLDSVSFNARFAAFSSGDRTAEPLRKSAFDLLELSSQKTTAQAVGL
jgi:hypothetical protein